MNSLTVRELIGHLQRYPQDRHVIIRSDGLYHTATRVVPYKFKPESAACQRSTDSMYREIADDSAIIHTYYPD